MKGVEKGPIRLVVDHRNKRLNVHSVIRDAKEQHARDKIDQGPGVRLGKLGQSLLDEEAA